MTVHCGIHYLKGLSQSKQTNESIKTFLESQARQIVPMLPDGNCLFRSVAHQLVGDAEQHDQLRQATVAFAAQNEEALKGYLPQEEGIGSASLQDHLQRMCNVGCWGTHFELRAMASMLQVPIYVLTDSLVPGECRWTRFCPWLSSGDNTASQSDESCTASWIAGVLQGGLLPQWVEICHSNVSHYDSIEFKGPGPHSPPSLSESSVPVVVVLE